MPPDTPSSEPHGSVFRPKTNDAAASKASPSDAPLAGIRVLELAAVLAGPSVGSFLAELGADVVKVENPSTGGDVTRGWRLPGETPRTMSVRDPKASAHPYDADAAADSSDPSVPAHQNDAGHDSAAPAGVPLAHSAYYASANYGKRVWMANLKDQADAACIQQALSEADIAIASFRPGADRRLGLDPESLLRRHPKLILARITGYGPDDPRAAYDLVLQAETGWMSMNGHPDQVPAKLPVALVDVLAAHQLKQAILLALWQRERDGSGRLVEVSLHDASLSALANQASNWLMAGHCPGPLGSLHPNIAPYGECFACADDQLLVLAVGAEAQFQALCDILELPELAEDPAMATNASRVEHRPTLQAALEPAFRRQNRDVWLERLQAAGVPAGAVCALDEVFSRAEAQRMVLEDALGTRVRQVAFQLGNAAQSSKRSDATAV
jgi:crotonobetainyl-CoA:carnitine CoA-transferase CaiB-like acyl-CoA transferase